ncbi:MAG: hypothetical protein EXX96DRAFT_548624 [Benjaminiella poitrasii]|nr:MAG: hypothetical protein EXX96DRAFT_548624 [Benjaminiella poitrasii]
MDLDEYYNIDSILAEQIKIPCIALHDYTKEANLNGNHTEVKRNSRVELPYWMAKPLAEYLLPANESLISVELPRTFGTKVRNALDASPALVDFRLLCPYFYIFGIKLLDLVLDDKLGGVLHKAFTLRLKEIMDFSRTLGTSKGQEFLQKLDETEKELFKAGQDSALQFKQWRDRAVHQIKTIDIGPKPPTL